MRLPCFHIRKHHLTKTAGRTPEEEPQRSATYIGEGDRRAVNIGQAEVRSRRTDLQTLWIFDRRCRCAAIGRGHGEPRRQYRQAYPTGDQAANSFWPLGEQAPDRAVGADEHSAWRSLDLVEIMYLHISL